jgi:nucleotide-binding universal stress UspA family protein
MKPIAKMTKRERVAILKNPNAKLSDLLEIAARDAIALQRQGRVRFNMFMYVIPPIGRSGKCSVCLAGAALYRDIGVTDAGTFDDLVTHSWALAKNMAELDHARKGVFTCVGETRLAERIIRRSFNESTWRAPFRTYIKAAKELRRVGL